jgi:transposase
VAAGDLWRFSRAVCGSYSASVRALCLFAGLAWSAGATRRGWLLTGRRGWRRLPAVPDVPDVPDVPPAEELSALPAAELAARLAEAYRVIGELTARAEQLAVVNERLTARVEELERQVRRDSASSSRPPSSDSPYKKKGRDRSLRERGKRRPGKQPGDPGTTMKLIDDPDARFWFPPAACRRCGKGLAGAAVLAQRRHQVTDIGPPPPVVTEYVAQAKQCPCCATVTEGELPPFVRARASFGPETCAQAANLTAGHHIPVYRSTLLLCQLAGITVSTGWMAGIRGRAAALVEASGFMDRVRELLKAAPAVHADETPARAAGGTRYVHLACTAYLTCMHTGDRSADAIDAGGVLPGYQGVIVRDGYAGYGHLTDALHAWCGVHYADTAVMPIPGGLVLAGGGGRACGIGIIRVLREMPGAGRRACSGRGCWRAVWSGRGLAA